jgi:hypothetical protein
MSIHLCLRASSLRIEDSNYGASLPRLKRLPHEFKAQSPLMDFQTRPGQLEFSCVCLPLLKSMFKILQSAKKRMRAAA